MSSGFFAYPKSKTIVTEAILGATEISKERDLKLTPWQKLDIIGFKIDDLIRDKISETDVFFGDITYPNLNVLYELGYAIAIRKPVIPTVNVAVERSIERLQSVGLFDTIAYASYTNASELYERLAKWQDSGWTNKHIKQKDHVQPLFILDTLKKTDFRNHIFHSIDHSHVHHRSFDPAEVPRLTAAHAISEASRSHTHKRDS